MRHEAMDLNKPQVTSPSGAENGAQPALDHAGAGNTNQAQTSPTTSEAAKPQRKRNKPSLSCETCTVSVVCSVTIVIRAYSVRLVAGADADVLGHRSRKPSVTEEDQIVLLA